MDARMIDRNYWIQKAEEKFGDKGREDFAAELRDLDEAGIRGAVAAKLAYEYTRGLITRGELYTRIADHAASVAALRSLTK